MRSVSVYLILFLVVPLNRCGDKEIKDAVKASDRLVENVVEAIDLTNSLEESGKITKVEWENLTERLRKAKAAAIALNKRAHEIISKKEDPDTPSNREEITRLLSAAVGALSQFKGAGVSQLKPEIQNHFSPVLQKINANVRAGIDALKCDPINDRCVKCRPDPPGEVICEP